MLNVRKSFSLLMSTCVISSIIISSSSAVSKENAKTYDVSLTVNGVNAYMLNEDMQQLPAILYNNSYYISIRTAGEWLGKDVSWNNDTRTITLSGQKQPKYYISTDIKGVVDYEYGGGVQITKRDDIKVLIDGAERKFYTEGNKEIYPIMYNGSTYLPVRSIADILDMEIQWENATEEQIAQISLKSKLSESDIKLFDEYKNTVINELEKYTDLAAGLYPNKSNINELEKILSDMQECLDNVLKLNPNISGKQNVIDAVTKAVRNNYQMIEKAHSDMKIQSVDELFAIEHGQSKGILMQLNVSAEIGNLLENLKDMNNSKLEYQNKELGFSIEFPNTWKGKYSVELNNADKSSSSVEIKTQWGGTLCYIFRNTQEQWQEMQQTESPVDYTLLAEDDEYVYLLLPASDVQYDVNDEEQTKVYNDMRNSLNEIKFEVISG